MGARCHQSVTRRTLTYMTDNAWGARILRVVRERKISTTLLPRSRLEKGRRVVSRIHVNCPWFNWHPERTTRKKVMLHNVLPFSVPLLDSKKNSFVQKVSKSFKKFRLLKFRRVPISVYTEIPLLLGSSLDVSEKVVTARHGLISF